MSDPQPPQPPKKPAKEDLSRFESEGGPPPAKTGETVRNTPKPQTTPDQGK